MNNDLVENTGGNTTYISAGLSYFVTPYFDIECNLHKAVFYRLNGIQNAESFRVTSGIQFLFY